MTKGEAASIEAASPRFATRPAPTLLLLAVVSECGFDDGIRLGCGLDLIDFHN